MRTVSGWQGDLDSLQRSDWVRDFFATSQAGPSVLRNFNPGIFGTGFLQNPGIPGFSGTGLTYFFHPGIDGIPGFFGTGLA